MTGNVLVFDAAASSYSAAILKNGKILFSTSENSTLTHSKTLLPAIEDILSRNKISVKDIDEIMLTIGPGSFTGLKIGAATAKGLAFPYKTPCVGVSTLAALAYGHSDFNGLIACALDARRNMLYCAFFRSENGKISRLTEDKQISASQAAERIKEENLPTLAVGDGAKILSKAFEDIYIYSPEKTKENIPQTPSAFFVSEKISRSKSSDENTPIDTTNDIRKNIENNTGQNTRNTRIDADRNIKKITREYTGKNDGQTLAAERIILLKDGEIVPPIGIFLAGNAEGEKTSPEKLVPRYLRKPQAERDREQKISAEIYNKG